MIVPGTNTFIPLASDETLLLLTGRQAKVSPYNPGVRHGLVRINAVQVDKI